MIRLIESVNVDTPIDQVFDYLVDFSNAAEWDPGIESAVQVTPGPIEVGTEFDLVARFLGTTADMRYRIEEIEPGSRIVIRGVGARAKSIDTVRLSKVGGQTQIEYQADLSMTGVARLFEPFLSGAMKKMGAGGP